MADIDIDLSFSYESGEGIFSRFGLSLHKGEHLLLIASPGSGKTTFARILTGAIPKYISGDLDGHFIVDGNDVLSLDIPERLEIVGRVSQNTDEMLLFSSVEEEISFPLENLGLEEEEIQKRISYALGLFGLGDPGDGVWMFVLSMIVYGVAFDFFNVSGALFVDKETDSSIRSSAQGLFMVMTNGIGATIGTLSAQEVIDRFVYSQSDVHMQLEGWSTSWLIFAGYALVVAVLFMLIFKENKAVPAEALKR